MNVTESESAGIVLSPKMALAPLSLLMSKRETSNEEDELYEAYVKLRQCTSSEQPDKAKLATRLGKCHLYDFAVNDYTAVHVLARSTHVCYAMAHTLLTRLLSAEFYDELDNYKYFVESLNAQLIKQSAAVALFYSFG